MNHHAANQQSESVKPASVVDNPLARRKFLAAGAATLTAARMVSADEYGADAAPVRYPDHRLVALDDRGKKLMLGNTPIQRLFHSKEMLWAEGPAWNGAGRYLIWSDIPNNIQRRWLEEDGHVSVFRNPANNSNGNTFDLQGRQISFEHLTRSVARYEIDGTRTVLADKYNGKSLNAPNDGAVHPNGDIWFTDPGYGALMDYEGALANTGSVQPYQKEAIYRIEASTGKVIKMSDEINKPNGLCFSPDYKKVYVADTGASHYPDAPKNIKVWDVVDGTSLANGKEFASMNLVWLRGWNSLRRRWKHLGQCRLGRAGLRWRSHFRRRGWSTDCSDSLARDLQQRLLRRHETQSPVHDRQSVSLRRLREHKRCSLLLRFTTDSVSLRGRVSTSPLGLLRLSFRKPPAERRVCRLGDFKTVLHNRLWFGKLQQSREVNRPKIL